MEINKVEGALVIRFSYTKYILFLFPLLTSCGILNSYLGESINYSTETLRKYDERSQILKVDLTPLDSFIVLTKDLGTLKCKIEIENTGEIRKIRVLKNTYKGEVGLALLSTISKIEFIPFINTGKFYVVIVVKQKKNRSNRISLSTPHRLE